MRYEVSTAARLSSHTCLHMSVIGFRFQAKLNRNLSFSIDLKGPGVFSKFGDQRISVVESLSGPDFVIEQ